MILIFVPGGGMLALYLWRKTDTGVNAERIAFYPSTLTVASQSRSDTGWAFVAQKLMGWWTKRCGLKTCGA